LGQLVYSAAFLSRYRIALAQNGDMEMTDQFAQASAVLVFALGAAAAAEVRSLQRKFDSEASLLTKEVSEFTTSTANHPSDNDLLAGIEKRRRDMVTQGGAIAILGVVWLVLVLSLIDAEIRCLRWLATKPRTPNKADALFVLRTLTAGVWLLLAPPAVWVVATGHATIDRSRRLTNALHRQRTQTGARKDAT
jgi:type II secretory pathway component PulM